MAGKQACWPFNKNIKHETKVGEHIHADLIGPMPIASLGGKQYAFSLQDRYSDYRDMSFLASKTTEETLMAAKHFVVWIQNQSRRWVHCIRTDNGMEFVNELWKEWCQSKGIIHKTTTPYSLAQNRVVERGNCTWMEHAHCMMHDSNMPFVLWAEAFATTIYLENLLSSSQHPTSSVQEVLFAYHPQVKHL